jgi:CPA1 family monovalent cation:H+ antiporter
MELFNIVAVLLTLSAIFSYINYKYLKIQMTIGLVLIFLFMSVCLMALDSTGFHLDLADMLSAVDFNETVMVGLLAFLLFTGAI